jgi:hypothetical protein
MLLAPCFEPMTGMGRLSKSNGITEGLHTKMEMMGSIGTCVWWQNFRVLQLRHFTDHPHFISVCAFVQSRQCLFNVKAASEPLFNVVT